MIPRAFVHRALIAWIALFMSLGVDGCSGEEMRDADFTIQPFDAPDGGRIEGALFSSSSPRVVILFHGKVFDKESWFDFARVLNRAGVDAFCVDFRGYGKSRGPKPQNYPADVLGSIEAMRAKGYGKIGLLGGSLGGAAILEALTREAPADVDRVAILAGFGRGLASGEMEKLFVGAEGDPAFGQLRDAFDQSSDPKRLEILEGHLHAQHLFKGEEGAKLTALLKDFFTRP